MDLICRKWKEIKTTTTSNQPVTNCGLSLKFIVPSRLLFISVQYVFAKTVDTAVLLRTVRYYLPVNWGQFSVDCIIATTSSSTSSSLFVCCCRHRPLLLLPLPNENSDE